MLRPLYMALMFFVLIAISIGFATADTHWTPDDPRVQEVIPPETDEPTERWEPRFGYNACISIQGFVPRMKEYGGELVSSGPISGGAAIVSVMSFPDNSFGIFIFDPVSGFVCNISTGWFAEPGTPV